MVGGFGWWVGMVGGGWRAASGWRVVGGGWWLVAGWLADCLACRLAEWVGCLGDG